MKVSLILLLLAISYVVDAGLVHISYGKPDDFNDDENDREYVPQSAKLSTCTSFNWKGIGYYQGDIKKMNEPWFDKTAQDSALVWTVSNIPANIKNPKIEMKLKGTGNMCYNDGFGFFWDENIPWRGGECRARYYKSFGSIKGLRDYDRNVVVDLTLIIGDATLPWSRTSILDKIKEEGYFHFFVGDDSTVDFFRFTYETEYDVDEITSFTCSAVESAQSTINEGQKCFTDSDLKINKVEDSDQKPFEGALSIKTFTNDKSLLTSTLKLKISSPTRFWVFVAEADISANLWLTLAGYVRLDGYVILSDGTKFIPFSKRYDGGRWVVFGAPSIVGTIASKMYFVAFAPAATQIPVPSNPAASCDCESTGDPHYVTWDNRKFDFYEEGVFHLVKARDCTFDVQAYSFKYGSRVTVNGIVGVRYFEDIVTLSRTPGSPGQLWTGSPTCRGNGEVIQGSTEVGGLKVTKVNSNEWKIQIEAVGLVVRAVAAGSWFHLYVSLSDLEYQKKVDGLCGNCDGDGKNDFKFPNCDNAIESTSTSLQWTQTIQWGTSWKVSTGQAFANLTALDLEGLGALTLDSCHTNPIRQWCDDLVPPETEDDGDPIVEPLPPVNFYACDGDTVVPIVDEEPPEVEVPEDIPPTSCDEKTFPKIKEKCESCAKTHHYDPEDCITDLCESGQNVDEYDCPGDNTCVAASEPETTITYGNYDWALLDGSEIEGVPEKDFCDKVRFLPPPGWEVAIVTDDAKAVIGAHGWSTLCVAVGDTSYPSKSCKTQEGRCPTKGTIVKTTDGCYIANTCNTKILIRKPHQSQCGNGILERDEDCDDGNTDDGDGCSSTCSTEPTHYCITTITPNLCSSVTNVVEEDDHDCPIDIDGCKGCIKTDENKDDDFCCDCQRPCCD